MRVSIFGYPIRYHANMTMILNSSHIHLYQTNSKEKFIDMSTHTTNKIDHLIRADLLGEMNVLYVNASPIYTTNTILGATQVFLSCHPLILS